MNRLQTQIAKLFNKNDLSSVTLQMQKRPKKGGDILTWGPITFRQNSPNSLFLRIPLLPNDEFVFGIPLL